MADSSSEEGGELQVEIVSSGDEAEATALQVAPQTASPSVPAEISTTTADGLEASLAKTAPVASQVAILGDSSEGDSHDEHLAEEDSDEEVAYVPSTLQGRSSIRSPQKSAATKAVVSAEAASSAAVSPVTSKATEMAAGKTSAAKEPAKMAPAEHPVTSLAEGSVAAPTESAPSAPSAISAATPTNASAEGILAEIPAGRIGEDSREPHPGQAQQKVAVTHDTLITPAEIAAHTQGGGESASDPTVIAHASGMKTTNSTPAAATRLEQSATIAAAPNITAESAQQLSKEKEQQPSKETAPKQDLHVLESLLDPPSRHAPEIDITLDNELLALQSHFIDDHSASVPHEGRAVEAAAKSSSGIFQRQEDSNHHPTGWAAPTPQSSKEIWQCIHCRKDNTSSSDVCAECLRPRNETPSDSSISPERMRPVVQETQDPAEAANPAGANNQPTKSGLLDMMETAVASVERDNAKAEAVSEVKQEPANKLESLMEMSVAHHEKSSIPGKDDQNNTNIRARTKERVPVDALSKEVPEVAGLEDGTSGTFAAEGKPSTQAQRQAGRIVGKDDPFENAIKKSIPSGGSSGANDADSKSMQPKPGGLSGMRKAYDVRPGANAPSSSAFSAWDGGAPEVTPDDDAKNAQKSGKADGVPVLLEGDDDDSDDSEVEAEWAEIGRISEEAAKAARERIGVAQPQDDILSKPISYKEVHQWLLQLEIDHEAMRSMREDIVDDTVCGCMGRRRAMSEVPGLDRKLFPDKDLVLFLKITEFDFNVPAHHRMLRTIFSKLARAKVCPTVGRHWEVLGFQGGDPRTDLNRSGGLLNIVQMFYFFSHYFDIFKAAYLLAQDVHQNFPLACVSINITKMVVECLLAGRLSKLCNSGNKGVFETTCLVYSGGMFHFYWRWRTQKRSIRDTEVTFKEVRALMEKRPIKLVEGLERAIKEEKAKSDPSRLQFTDLDFTGRSPPTASGKAAVPQRLRNYHSSE
eukprot:TRINITY_DN42355_c0_g1_i1.p1 TRINITY_DN42355_c0_g1~~TRINITY_DN42355_c0_g1_i1.p1  ORF type:complete len:979 (-),score=216.43 TRINITY_DN42355_c0_g1_i1:72-3008(-)